MKKIIHIDMDCFYAAIEMRDEPKFQKLPLAVGGDFLKRGVLCTCNYIARQFGVRSAMPTAQAYRLCPDLIVVHPNMSKYKKESEEIREIFRRHTSHIEPLSLDEAFLDVSNSQECFGSATWLAEKIRSEIFSETGLTASAGVAQSKFLAKIASDWNKPNGQFVIPPEKESEFLQYLSVGKIFGVGKVTLKKLQGLGIETCGELQRFTLPYLIEKFGTFGKKLYELSRGIDEREVQSERVRKSISVEHTYFEDLPNLQACLAKVPKLFSELQTRCREKSIGDIKGIFVKIKFSDFSQTTVDNSQELMNYEDYLTLIKRAFMRKQKPVRLLGIGLRLNHNDNIQLSLI